MKKWNTDIIDANAKVDYAFIDSTFYDRVEINNRDIAGILPPSL